MRCIVVTLTILACVLASAGAARAGVYNLDPPRKYPSDFMVTNVQQPLWYVMNYIGELRAVHDLAVKAAANPPAKDSLRVSYENQYAALEEKRKDGKLDVMDRINLSACLIRLGRTSPARDLLEESLRLVPGDDGLRFLLLLNLAAIHQDDDNLLQRAIDLQREALQSWPNLVPGWNRLELAWYHRAETYALAIMELRKREQLLAGGRQSSQHPPPDRLFPLDERDPAKKVQFIGDSGEYEAGGIALKQLERLPADADQIVLQLLLWRPLDPRLFWLYGELLNARGQVYWAHRVLDSVYKDNQWRNRELDRHIRVLREAVNPYVELFTDSAANGQNLRNQALLLWWLAPRGALTPGVGGLLNETGGLATATFLALPADEPAPAPAAAANNPLPDWRPFTVGFLLGIVVAVLGILQWRQWRRQRRIVTADRLGDSRSYAPKGNFADPSSYSRPTDG